MNTDYKNAARRHYEDAEILFNRLRWANADQLYGLAAECGLKAVMVGLGAPTTSTGDLKERIHMDKLWDSFRHFVINRNRAQKYLGYLSGYPGNPFQDWNISQRYANTSEFQNSNDDTKPSYRVISHQSAASMIIKKILQQAQNESLI